MSRHGVVGIGAALRLALQQASVRPAGSLIVSQPSTSFGASCYLSPCRSMAKMPSMGGFDPWSFFDYRKFMYPDVYNANDALLCSRYKTHGSVIERYDPPKPFAHWNILVDPELDKRLKHMHRRLYMNWTLYRCVSGYSTPKLQARILEAYKAVNQALATGQMQQAEPFVSEQMLQRLGGEVMRRGRNRVEWRMVREPDPREIELVSGDVVHNPMRHGKLRFAQWTARIPSKQVVAVFDPRGKVLAGDPDKELDVVDYWVFERPILQGWVVPRTGPQGADWRLVERLSF